MVMLDNGKLEVVALENGQFESKENFQLGNTGANTGQWDRFDASRFYSGDAQEGLNLWEIDNGMVPVFGANAKLGVIKKLSQSYFQRNLLSCLTDKNNIGMLIK